MMAYPTSTDRTIAMATRIRPKAQDLYEEDFYVWTEAQAELLRQRQLEALDLDNLIEEVEGLGDAKDGGGLELAPEFFIEWPDRYLPHQVRLQGCDAS
jgi:Domain of unknown function DUF29